MTQYLAGRDIDINDVIGNADMMEKFGVEFLNDIYPGMLKAPNELIKLMTAEDADMAVASMALNPSNDPCDESNEMITETTDPTTTLPMTLPATLPTTLPTVPHQTGGKKCTLISSYTTLSHDPKPPTIMTY